jgi:hypothetical protein
MSRVVLVIESNSWVLGVVAGYREWRLDIKSC